MSDIDSNGRGYNPQPADTSAIVLDSELTSLAELMAENVHDEWARQRMNDGWTYGPQRDDAAKKHPCLVPYGDLPDSEKEYDRISSISTLKLILSKGFKIVKE